MSGEREVQRYRHYYNTWCGSESEAFSVEDPDGDWVKRDDHVRVVDELRSERGALLETLGRDGQYLKTEATEEERSIEGAAYRGRSVYAWWSKAHAYGCMVHGINPILGAREGEHANDAARRVVAERDAALLRVEGLRAERAVFNATIDEVQAGWRECQSALRHAEELLANQAKETEARRSERDAALLRVGEAEKLLREAMPWLGEWARAEGITERIEGFLGGVGEGS